MALHPEAVKLCTDFSRDLAGFNRAKLDLEYTVQLLDAKGLLPTQSGLPDSLGVDPTTGCIGGNMSTLSGADYAQAVVGLNGLVAFIQTPVDDDGPSVEKALQRFAAA